MKTWMLALCFCAALGCQSLEPDQGPSPAELEAERELTTVVVSNEKAHLDASGWRTSSSTLVHPPETWEYKIVSLIDPRRGIYVREVAEERMNNAASEGWSFVTIFIESQAIFRRPKRSTGKTLEKVDSRILPELSQVRIMICAGGDWAAHRSKRAEHFAKKKSAEMCLVHVENNEIGKLYKDENKTGRENWNKVIVLAAATKAKELYDLTPASKEGKHLDIVLDVDREVPNSYVKQLLDALVKQGIDSSQFMVVTSGEK